MSTGDKIENTGDKGAVGQTGRHGRDAFEH